MTPVMASRPGGMLPAFACSWAAEDDKPNAHTDPMPTHAAAPAAR